MAANTVPIFIRTPKLGFVAVTSTAVTSLDGTDANVATVFTADATNGSKINTVYVYALGSAAQTVVRFWVNNGASAGSATNNVLVHEETLPAITVTQTSAASTLTWNCNLPLPPGYKLLAAHGTATASGLAVAALGGDY